VKNKSQGQFVFSTEEMLKIVQEAEETPLPKQQRGRPPKHTIDQIEEEDSDSSSGGLVIVVDHPTVRRTR
jgi:hypothetical protein